MISGRATCVVDRLTHHYGSFGLVRSRQANHVGKWRNCHSDKVGSSWQMISEHQGGNPRVMDESRRAGETSCRQLIAERLDWPTTDRFWLCEVGLFPPQADGLKLKVENNRETIEIFSLPPQLCFRYSWSLSISSESLELEQRAKDLLWIQPLWLIRIVQWCRLCRPSDLFLSSWWASGFQQVREGLNRAPKDHLRLMTKWVFSGFSMCRLESTVPVLGWQWRVREKSWLYGSQLRRFLR